MNLVNTTFNRAPQIAAAVYAIACCILTVGVVVSTSIHADDYYIDHTNFTIFTYHVPDDEDYNGTDWFLPYTDSPQGGAGNAKGTNDIAKSDRGGDYHDPATKHQQEESVDVVATFLEKVEEYERNKGECIPGTEHNLGSGVIKQYGLKKFKNQALVAVNRANFLTRLWRNASGDILTNEYIYYSQVRNLLEGDPELFAAGNCYDKGEFKNYYLFCPYAYRMEDGRINVKDLSLEYDYLKNTSEWFYSARQKATQLENFNFTEGKPNMLFLIYHISRKIPWYYRHG